MALSEVSVVDKVEVLLNGSIQVRRRDQILKDGVEVKRMSGAKNREDFLEFINV